VKLIDILMMAGGALLASVGVIRIIGSVSLMFDPGDTTGPLEHLGIIGFLGLVPITVGGLLFHRAYRRSREDDRENEERQLLLMAERRGGKLTAAEIASHSTYTLEEAATLLAKLHTDGVAEMCVTDGGAIIYRFPGLVDENGRDHAEGFGDFR